MGSTKVQMSSKDGRSTLAEMSLLFQRRVGLINLEEEKNPGNKELMMERSGVCGK